MHAEQADSQIVPLDRIEADCCAVIHDVLAGDADTDRLKAMGVCIGRRVILVRRGDPLILKVLGSRLGVSARLARQVLVREVPSLP